MLPLVCAFLAAFQHLGKVSALLHPSEPSPPSTPLCLYHISPPPDSTAEHPCRTFALTFSLASTRQLSDTVDPTYRADENTRQTRKTLNQHGCFHAFVLHHFLHHNTPSSRLGCRFPDGSKRDPLAGRGRDAFVQSRGISFHPCSPALATFLRRSLTLVCQ